MAFVNAFPTATRSFSTASPLRCTTFHTTTTHHALPTRRTVLRTLTPSSKVSAENSPVTQIRGPVFVVHDNIDTDQIIPAEYLTLVPSDPGEYAQLGTFAMDGLPRDRYPTQYVAPGARQTEYPIIIAGANFGCGSSREHAPVAIGAAGGLAVVAESYARIFFRNCSATGELYPWETPKPIVDYFTTGDVGLIDFEKRVLRNETTGKEFQLNDLGDVKPVIDAGGIFEYARKTGMISKE